MKAIVQNRKYRLGNSKTIQWQTYLNIGSQQFSIGEVHDTLEDANWYASQLVMALSHLTFTERT